MMKSIRIVSLAGLAVLCFAWAVVSGAIAAHGCFFEGPINLGTVLQHLAVVAVGVASACAGVAGVCFCIVIAMETR